jgi:branched-chain amino acid transport system ATP-binding protein
MSAAAASAPFFAVEALSKHFGGIQALNDISFSVSSGEAFGIIGSNGAGKTTVLNCLSGVLPADSGRAVLDGVELLGRRPHWVARHGVARTFQGADYFNDSSVLEYLLFGRIGSQHSSIWLNALGLAGTRSSELRQRAAARQLLDEYGLADLEGEPVRSLSYGTRKLLDVLRSLLMEPKLLLLDEPTSGTGGSDRDVLRVLLGRIRDRGITTVVVDHDTGFIAKTCDRVLAIGLGAEICTGTPAAVLSNQLVIESYVGVE